MRGSGPASLEGFGLVSASNWAIRWAAHSAVNSPSTRAEPSGRGCTSKRRAALPLLGFVELPVLIQAVGQLAGMAIEQGRVQVPAVLHQGRFEPVPELVPHLDRQLLHRAGDHRGVPVRELAVGLRRRDQRELRLHGLRR